MSHTKKNAGRPVAAGGWFRWVQVAFLFTIWLLLSGKMDPFHLATGVLAVFIIVWLDRKLGPANLEESDLPLRPHLGKLLGYLPWLMGQMLLSTWHVAKVILSPAMPLQPVLVRFVSPQPHTIARVVLGNSITLTPGTLTLDIDRDLFLVHALTEKSARSVLDGTMQRKVAAAFSAELNPPVINPEILTGRRGP